MVGSGDGTFRPRANITRAEAVTAVNRMLGRKPDREQLIKEYTNPYVDLPQTHWAYADLIEATITHSAEYIDGVESWLR